MIDEKIISCQPELVVQGGGGMWLTGLILSLQCQERSLVKTGDNQPVQNACDTTGPGLLPHTRNGLLTM